MRHDRERAFYRVEYPIQERPELVLSGDPPVRLPVFDVSEHGVRFAHGSDVALSVGDHLEGTLQFRDRAEDAIRGEVVWVRTGSAALRLATPIPFGRILAEQQYLRSRYRDLLG